MTEADYTSKPEGEGFDLGLCPQCKRFQYIPISDKVLWKCVHCETLVENDRPYILGINVETNKRYR